jgi:hypothetical protein
MIEKVRVMSYMHLLRLQEVDGMVLSSPDSLKKYFLTPESVTNL